MGPYPTFSNACISKMRIYVTVHTGGFYQRRYCNNNSEMKPFCQTTRKIWGGVRGVSIVWQFLENGDVQLPRYISLEQREL